MTKRRRRRQASDGELEVIDTITLNRENQYKKSFKEDGSFEGPVNLTVVARVQEINSLRISARTSSGWGQPSTEGLINSSYSKGQSNEWVYIVVVLVILFAICLGIAIF